MNNNSGNHFFPFPVLGNKKSIGGVFDFVNLKINEEDSKVKICGVLRCTNKTIMSLCIEGGAESFGHIECIRTSFRGAFKTKRWSSDGESEININIESNLLRGNAELGFFIIASRPIENYFPHNLDPLYGKAKFNIPRKAILAVSKRLFINFEEEFVKSSNASIFVFDKGSESDLVYWDFDRTDGKIGIMVPPNDLNTIRNLRTSELFIRTTIVSYVLPALAQALRLVFSPDDYGWKTPLKALIDRAGLEINHQTDIDTTYKIAQKILVKKEIHQNIFSVMLQEILNPVS